MEFNSILFPSSKSKVSLEALLNGKLAYIPKLKAIAEDSQIPRSPRSLRPLDNMTRYSAREIQATKNIRFDAPQMCDSLTKPIMHVSQKSLQSGSDKFSGATTMYQQTSRTMRTIQEAPAGSISSPFVSLTFISNDDTQSHAAQTGGPAGILSENSNPNTPRDRFLQGCITHRCTCSFSSRNLNSFNSCQTCGPISNNNYNNSSSSSNQNATTSLFGTLFSQQSRTADRKFSSQPVTNHTTTQSEKNSPVRPRHRNTISSPFHLKITRESSSTSISNSIAPMLSSRELTNSGFTEAQLANPAFLGFNMDTHIPVGFVPIFYLESAQSENLLIYFHGNGDDIFSSYPLLAHLRTSLAINIMAVEYPGYGNYKSNAKCNAETVLEDADYVFDFAVNQLRFKRQNIILMGRSVGTGPATYLASKHAVGALALISGFTSIRGVVSDFAGFFKYIVKERFSNIDRIQEVVSPTFLLHGKKDSLISFKQSVALKENCKKAVCELLTPLEMDHQSFNYAEDLTTPFKEFLKKHQYPLNAIHFSKGFTSHLPEGLTFHPSQNAAYTLDVESN